MPCVAGRTRPALWASVKAHVTRSACCGTKRGQWSARKAQQAGHLYLAKGGAHCGQPTRAQRSMRKWTGERWTTKSGLPSSLTGERMLPARVIRSLSAAEYASSTAKKRRDTARGIQYSAQPSRVARKAARLRDRRRM